MACLSLTVHTTWYPTLTKLVRFNHFCIGYGYLSLANLLETSPSANHAEYNTADPNTEYTSPTLRY